MATGDEELRVKITAEIDNALKQFIAFANAFDDLIKVTKELTGQFSALSAGIGKFDQEAGKAGARTKKFVSAAGNANTVMTNLGRVASDLPFGFIAIQNNIDPLIQSFGELFSKTKKDGPSAFKQLAASMLGAGGIGLAFTIASALTTKLVQDYGSLSAAIGALNPFLSLQERILNELNAQYVKSAQATTTEIGNVDLLVKSVKDLNVPLEERQRITKELIKQYPDTFQGLTAEAIAAGKADDAYKELTKTLLAQAAVRAGADLIGERGKDLLELRIRAAKLNDELVDLQQNGLRAGNAIFGKSVIQNSKDIAAVQSSLNANKAKQNKLEKETALIQQEQLKLVEQFGAKVLGIKGNTDVVKIFQQLSIELAKVDERAKLTGESAKKIAQTKLPLLSKAFDEIANIGGDKARPILKDIGDQINRLQGVLEAPKGKTIADILKELNASLAATDAQAKLFGGTADNLANEKINALNKAFNDLVQLGLKPTSPELIKIAKQINLLSASIIGIKPIDSKFIQPLGKAVRTTKVKPLTPEELEDVLGLPHNASQLLLEPKVKIEPIFQEEAALENLDKFSSQFTAKMGRLSADAAAEFKKKFIILGDNIDLNTAVLIDLQHTLSSALSAIAEGIGVAIGNILSGKGSLQEVLGGLIGIMADFITQFGKTLIEAASLRIIAEKTLVANPYVALAAGIAAVAVGAALKNAVPAFATGGTVYGPTLAMIGDNPGREEHIIPSEVLDKMQGGWNMPERIELFLSGVNATRVLERGKSYTKRVNG